ncbi:DUF5988 family protein [Streptosporangium sp. NPDC000563]|uniref:DUF5988 family protein n=1 Tax=unclassified Streptosporangium TaxID=2632669 RepID=UPI003321EFD0
MSVSIDQGGQESGAEGQGHSGFAASQLERTYVDVVLEGGPADISRTFRVDDATAAYGKIKIPRHNGYEHFERQTESVSDDSGAAVFRWTTRTRIAE